MIIFAYIWCRNCKLQVGNHWVHPVRNIDSITYSNLCTERIKNLSFTENICETSVVEYLCLFYDTYSCLRSNNLSVIMVTACGAESNRAAKLLWGHAIFLRWFTLWFPTWSLQLLHQKYAKVWHDVHNFSKTERKYFLISALASKKSSNKKLSYIIILK